MRITCISISFIELILIHVMLRSGYTIYVLFDYNYSSYVLLLILE